MINNAIANAIYMDEPMTWLNAFVMEIVSLVLAVPAVAGLYLVKSALGINLMAGPSPLHDLLYHFVV